MITEPAALQCGLLVGRTLTPSDQFTDVPVRVMNLDKEPKRIEEGTVVSDLEPVTVLEPVNSGAGSSPESAHCTPDYVKNPGYLPLPEYMDKLAKEVDPSTPDEVVSRLRGLMMKYRQIFSESDQDLGLTRSW